MKNKDKEKLKGNKEEKEDLNNQDSIKEDKKEGKMVKRCRTGYTRSGKKYVRRKPTKKSVRKAKLKWW
ncbi:MAG: hypothetical protein Q8N99_08760 [Nanoarchaeota archaeon]|nr:hypothetical protein [Nanoarchaeota archaeon]